VSVVALGFGGCAVLSIHDFLDIWLTKEPEHNPIIGTAFLVLLIGLLPDLMTSVSGMGLRAINKHSFHAVQNVFEGLANVTLSIVLADRFGLIGVAMGTAISGFVTKFFVQPVYCCRFFEIPPVTYYWNVIIGPLLMAGSVTGAFHLASLLIEAPSYLVVAGRLVGFLVVYGALAGFLFLRPHERAQILELVRIRRGGSGDST
jgi:O-antigen/teichoic acid export membrane protein